jgi:hypothetical protein
MFIRNTRKRHFSPGDEVLVLLPTESTKMTATLKGPFRIVRKLSDVNYQVNVGARRGLGTYHINLLHLEGTMCPSFSIWFKSCFTSSRRA